MVTITNRGGGKGKGHDSEVRSVGSILLNCACHDLSEGFHICEIIGEMLLSIGEVTVKVALSEKGDESRVQRKRERSLDEVKKGQDTSFLRFPEKGMKTFNKESKSNHIWAEGRGWVVRGGQGSRSGE